jgi:hypothetical protein
MKICFRIGAEPDGSQQPKRYRSARVKVQLLRPRRLSGAHLSAAQPVSRQTAPTAKGSLKTERIFRSGHTTSDPYWPKNRSYRKQAIKPCLTGTRIACKDSDFLALFDNSLAVSHSKRKRLRGTILLWPRAAKRGDPVSDLYRGRMLLLARETATNGLHRTYPE